MQTLSLATRLFLACFIASALLFAGIFFYVKGFNGQRESARAEQAFEGALLRYAALLHSYHQSPDTAARSIAEGTSAREAERAKLLSTGLSFVVLRASGAEPSVDPFSAQDASALRALASENIAIANLSSGRYLSRSIAKGHNDSWNLVVLFPLADFERASQELLEAFLVSGLALLLLTTIFSQLLSREIARPLTLLRNNVRAMATEVGLEPPTMKGDEISEMATTYFEVVKNMHTAFAHKKLALQELEAYKSELLRVNQNLHRRLFQVKVLLSLWSERDKALDVKDFLSRFLEAALPGLPFEFGCVIIRPLADMRSETIFVRKLNAATPSPEKELLTEEATGKSTQGTDIIDPAVKEFLLKESEECMQSHSLKVGVVGGRMSSGAPVSRITSLSLRLQQGDEPLGSMHFLTEQGNPVFAPAMTEFLLNLSMQVAAQLQIQALSHANRVDPLTRLYNRGFLNDKLREELVRSARKTQAFSMILLDIDHFKMVNETHGRPAADEVLRGLAGLLKKICRGSDSVCRYSGAEIAILLADTPLPGARIFAENVRKAVSEEKFTIPGGTLQITVSMGIAEYPAHGKGLEELLAKAEHALAEAKIAGRNGWRAA